MLLELLDVDKLVKTNQLLPVTDPIFLEANSTPTPRGLFSLEIFGRLGSEDRRRRWAYLDLGGRFLHPLVFKTMGQLDRKIGDVITGERTVRVSAAGALVDDAAGWSGLDELWGHWKELTWAGEGPDPSGQRGERVRLLRLVPREVAFVTKWPVIPAIFRDIDSGAASGGRIKEIPPINALYAQLLTAAPTTLSGIDFLDGTRKLRAQNLLLDIQDSFLDLIAGKRGVIQDRILGKYADWSVQGVISGPALAKSDRPGDQEVPFGALGVPLYQAVNLYQPFVVKSLQERFAALAGGQERVLLPRRAGEEPRYLELPPDARQTLGPDLYKRWISRFMRSRDNRTDLLTVEGRSGKSTAIPLYDAALGRPTTLTDLFFIAVSKIIEDKYVMFTRYPVEDFRACHFAKPVLLTTELTDRVVLGSTTYPRYPRLGGPGMRWVDSIRLNNSYTSALGADYDGDRCRVFGLFTQEANAQAAEQIRKTTNFMDGQGRASRQIKNEGVLTLYMLTR